MTRWLRTLGLLGLLGCRPEPPPVAPSDPTPLHATRPAEVSELCVPELHSWSVLDDNGAPVAVSRGRCLGAIEHPVDGPLWHFVAQYQIDGEPRPSWELHMWLDAFGSPRHAQFRTPLRVTKYSWDGDGLELRRFGDRMWVEHAAELWIVPSHGLYVRELMLRLGVGVEAGQVRQRSLAPEHDAIAELELAITDAGELAGEHSSLRLDGLVGGLAGIRIRDGSAGRHPRYRSLGSDTLAEFLPDRPQPSYSRPDELELVEIEVAERGPAPRLSGELVLPRERDPAAKLPAVFFIAGAGAQDRHGLVPEAKIDLGSHEIHDALARAGFVVLRVDDRGVGGSELGEEPAPGFLALVDDARRSLAVLAARPEVDARRVFVIGHGEGALIASMLAAEGIRVGGRPRALAGLILLAAAGRNLRELVYDEIRASMVGRREAEVRAAIDRARSVHDAAIAGADLPASNVGARTWMIEAFAEDPLKRLRAVKVPVLALQGGKDFQVSSERDFVPIANIVATKKRSEARLIDGLDHLFKPEPGTSTPGHYSDLERHVAPEFLAIVLGWLSRSPQ